MSGPKVEDFSDRVARGAPPDLDAEGEPMPLARPRLMSDAFVAGAELMKRGKPKNALRTGFDDLDHGLKLYGPEEVTMLAADSGIGKSTIATQAALHAGATGHGVAYFNLEMSEAMYGLRTASNFTRIPTKAAAAGTITDEQRVQVHEAFDALRVAASRVTLGNSQEHRTVPAIKAEVTRAAKYLEANGTPLKLIVIDHVLQVLVNIRNDKDAEGKARADLLKDLATEHKAHVLALVHVTRDASKGGKMPTKNELASSAWFDRHADNILVFHQKRTPEGTFDAKQPAILSCQKARWGEPFKVELRYEGGFFYAWSLGGGWT